MKIGTIREIWRYPVKSMAGELLDSAEVGPNGLRGDRGWAIRDVAKRECRGAKQWPVLLDCRACWRAEPPGDMATEGAPHVDITLPDGSRLASDSPDVNERLSALLRTAVTFEPLRPATDLAFYRRSAPGSALVGRLAKSKTFVRGLQKMLSATGADAELREAFARESGEPLPDLSELPAEVLEFTSPPGTYFDAFPIHLVTTATLAAMQKKAPASAWDSRRFRPNFLLETEPGHEGLLEAEWGGRTVSIGGLRLRADMPTPRCGMTMQAQAGLPRDPAVLRSIVKDADQCLGLYANVATPGIVRVGDAVTLE